MRNLSSRDYERMLDLAAAVVAGMVTEPPWFLISRELNDCLHGSATVFHSELDPASGAGQILAWAPDVAGQRSFNPRVRDQGREHPFAGAYTVDGVRVPVTVSDVVDDRTWQRNPWYEATRRRFSGATRHLGLPVPTAAGAVRGLIVCRSGRDFGTRDREFARRLQPLLVGVDRHLAQLRHLRDSAPTLDEFQLSQQRAAELGITPREGTVLMLLAEGLTAVAAARRLGISPHTVTKHQENIYRKLGTRDRVSTVVRAQKFGLVHSGPTVPAAG